MSAPFPQNYDEWHHCITVECGIALTSEFVAERLSIWRNAETEETKRFIKLYGEEYLHAVVGWFEVAERELAA